MIQNQIDLHTVLLMKIKEQAQTNILLCDVALEFERQLKAIKHEMSQKEDTDGTADADRTE